MVIGLTGGIGSGKSTVLSLFKDKPNVVTYIADDKAKDLMQSNDFVKKQLIKAFGKQIFKNNILDKVYLSKLVFNDKSKLSIINDIVHPAVKEDFFSYCIEHKGKIVIFESAILFEANSAKNCNKIISVTAPLKERIQRVKLRDAVDEKTVMNRINNQYTDTQRNIQSHYIIYNDEIDETAIQVNNIYNILTKNPTFI